jgi:hypothetical protein
MKQTTAFHVKLESMEWLAQQLVRAPVTVRLVAFRQQAISLVLLQMTALLVTLEGIST